MKKIEEGICPICGADIDYEGSFFEDDQVGMDWTCPECDAEGTEWYDLQFSTSTVSGEDEDEDED